jgi:tetratricopeptide (TPR) repeat protein
VAYLALGDVASFDAHTAELRSVATERRAWFGMALGTSLAAMRALVDGRFSDAAALVDETLALGAGDASIEAAYAGQLFALHRETGRLEDLLPLLEQAVVDNPIVVAFRVGLVLAKAATGDLDGARRGFEGLAADRFAAVPRDYAYVVSLAFLAETCTVLDDVARAGELYDLLRPHQGHLVLTGWGVLCGGAVDRYLAMLLTVMGKWDEAGEAFARALALETELASPPLVARTKYWYARMLVNQAMPADGADRARGQAMVTDVEEASIALGMAGLAADARDLALQCEVPRAG